MNNRWGLRPAVVDGTREIAPLTAFRDLDGPGLLATSPPSTSTRTCRTTNCCRAGKRGAGPRAPAGRPARPHPFTAAGNTEFNALIWMPPNGQRAGDIVLVDSTHFTTLFGGTDSLEAFWRNLARME